MEGFHISSGGRLLETKWVYDESKGEGEYITSDVTDEAPYHLFDVCSIEEGVLLKDIFQLMARHMDIFKIVINQYIEEIVAEGLHPYEGQEVNVQSLELYWYVDYSEKDGIFARNTVPQFHGIGEEEIPYFVNYLPANSMAHLPVTLSQNFTIELYDTKNAELIVYQGPKFTLGQILSGIVWELGRSGSPERRDRIRREIEHSIAQNN